MNLVVDMGNTRTKVALFVNDQLFATYNYGRNPLPELKKLIAVHPEIRRSIVSSVVHHSKEVINFLQNKTLFHFFDTNSKIPIPVVYKTPDTLGRDRLAAAVASFSLSKGQNALSIDAGTCIKFDLVLKGEGYKGGSISPGLSMRYRALNQFTDQLPLFSPEPEFHVLCGQSTEESIRSGVQLGAIHEIKGFIEDYQTQYPDLFIVLTGGDASFFELALKNSIFVCPHLVMQGLNEILNFNVAK